MKNTDSLGDRMKGYENVHRHYLLRRTPVIIRVDGKAFHTFTKRFNSYTDSSMQTNPFSHRLHAVMTGTAVAMMGNIQNAVLAYTQSDEISILLKDWSTLTTDQWFGGNLQKIASTSAAMASAYFNFLLNHEFRGHQQFEDPVPTCIPEIPLFDARVYNIPDKEVNNYFIWRQQDATRNSINMLARYYFSQKELHGKNVGAVQDMLMLERGVNWNNIETWKKRGSCVRLKRMTDNGYLMSDSPTILDDNPPIFTQDRNYINDLLEIPE